MSRSTVYTCDICGKKSETWPTHWCGLRFATNNTFEVWQARYDECGKHICGECSHYLMNGLNALVNKRDLHPFAEAYLEEKKGSTSNG